MLDQSQVAYSMRIWEDHQLRTLQRYYPDWSIWLVRNAGPSDWCAAPKAAPSAKLVTQSPEHLVRLISEPRD